MPESIYISTRSAAKLADVEPHVLYTAFRRHGHWRSVSPRKGEAGRLAWPADLVRAMSVPVDTMPSGLEVWTDHARSIVPEAPEPALHALAMARLGSEGTLGWKPAPGQLSAARLETEAQLLAMEGQALAERLDMARVMGTGNVSAATGHWMARVLRNLLRSIGDEVVA